MLSPLLLDPPKALGRERTLTAALLLCMGLAIAIQLILSAQTRLANDYTFHLPDGSEVMLVDPRRPAGPGTGKASGARTRVELAIGTLHTGAPTIERIAFVDPSFPQIFQLTSCGGSLNRALTRGDELVLTESTAQRLFGLDNPIGRSMVISVGDEAMVLRVGAVACTPPPSPHLTYSMLATLEPFILMQPGDKDRPGDPAPVISTYMRLPKPSGSHEFMRTVFGVRSGGDVGQPPFEPRMGAGDYQVPSHAAVAAGRVSYFMVLLQGLAWSIARLVPRRREAALNRRIGKNRWRLTARLALDPLLLASTAGLLALSAAECWFGGSLPYGGRDGALATLAVCLSKLLCVLGVAPLANAIGGWRMLGQGMRAGRAVAPILALAQGALAVIGLGFAASLSVQTVVQASQH